MEHSKMKSNNVDPSKSSSESSIREVTKTLNNQPIIVSTTAPLSHSIQFHKNNQVAVPSTSSENFQSTFFNPLFHHSNLMNPINFNYMNQGIFIPRSENNQFSFIPGNIGYESNKINNFPNIIPEFQYDNVDVVSDHSEKHNNVNTSSKQIYFVPTQKNKSKSIQDELKDNNYETYLVPIKIKKEMNGNIELLPQSDTEMVSQPLKQDQLNILKKIYLLKNQKSDTDKPIKQDDFAKMVKVDEVFIDKCEETSADDGKCAFNNIKDKTQGFMVFRFNKLGTNSKPEDKSEVESATVTSNSLRLSTAKSSSIREDKSQLIKIKKKGRNVHKLILSAQTDKNISIPNPPSRFRRLRLDDKKSCWNVTAASCIDTKMREIPAYILDLSELNSISISYSIFSLFNQPKMFNDLSGMEVTCEHTGLQDKQSKENAKETFLGVTKKLFWTHMCSMNNGECSTSQKSIF